LTYSGIEENSGISVLEPEKIVSGGQNQYFLEVLSNRNQEKAGRG
jgi:hypothetical protein